MKQILPFGIVMAAGYYIYNVNIAAMLQTQVDPLLALPSQSSNLPLSVGF